MKNSQPDESDVRAGAGKGTRFRALFSKLTGTEFPHGLQLRNLFGWDRGRKTLDEESDPGPLVLTKISPEWPRLRLFPRILLASLAAVAIFAVKVHFVHNPLNVPALIIAGALAIPVACVAFFFEVNVLRNISVFQTAVWFILGGAIASTVSVALDKFALPDKVLGMGIQPIIEELSKIFAALLLMGKLRNSQWILNGVLAGAAVGAGFHGVEAAGFLYESLLLQTGEFYRILIWRSLYAPFLHVAFTALAVGAVWMAKESGPFSAAVLLRWPFLRIFLLVAGLHIFWNEFFDGQSPVGMMLFVRIAVEILISIVSAILVLSMVQTGLSQIRKAQSNLKHS